MDNRWKILGSFRISLGFEIVYKIDWVMKINGLADLEGDLYSDSSAGLSADLSADFSAYSVNDFPASCKVFPTNFSH